MRECKKIIDTFIKLREDGKLYMLMPLPEGIPSEEVNEAVSAGVIKLVDGAMADEPKNWELYDGKF